MPPVKFTLQNPDWYDRKLRLAAYVKGSARSTLGAKIIQDWVDDNWATIDTELNFIARQRGISREDLEAEILAKKRRYGGTDEDEDGEDD